MINKRLIHANRYREIAHAFLRNGLGFVIKDIGLSEAMSLTFKKQSNISNVSLGERIRNLLQDLGTTFIKLGQIGSTRRDIFPPEVITELEKLQNLVPPFPFTEAKQIIQEELSADLDQIFASFQDEPFASASIGQVHLATLYSGEQVVVKVQRPNIRKVIETDLEILGDLARLMDAQLEWAQNYHLLDIVSEFSKSLLAELDYSIEARNGEKIAKQFQSDSTIHIPKIYWEHSTKKVLTMQFIEGIKINDLEQLILKGYNRKIVAERFTNCMLQQIFIDGFFHGDPHPGNVIIMPENEIGLLDFGMVGRLSPEMKHQFVSMIIALKNGESEEIIKILLQMGIFPDDINMASLQMDIDTLIDTYYDLPLGQVHLGELINEFFQIASRYKIHIPSEFTILGKSLMTFEGIVSYLDPDCNVMEYAEPFAEKLLKERYNPKKVIKTSWKQLKELTEVLSSLPKNLNAITSTVQKGKLHLEITVTDLPTILKKIDSVSNRLAFSIVLLSFSIVMVGLIIGNSIGRQSLVIWNLPIIEIGAVVATLMFLWLLYSIFRSGRL